MMSPASPERSNRESEELGLRASALRHYFQKFGYSTSASHDNAARLFMLRKQDQGEKMRGVDR